MAHFVAASHLALRVVVSPSPPTLALSFIAWQQQQIDASVAATEACRLAQERLQDQVQNDLQAFLAVADERLKACEDRSAEQDRGQRCYSS